MPSWAMTEMIKYHFIFSQLDKPRQLRISNYTELVTELGE